MPSSVRNLIGRKKMHQDLRSCGHRARLYRFSGRLDLIGYGKKRCGNGRPMPIFRSVHANLLHVRTYKVPVAPIFQSAFRKAKQDWMI